MESSGPVALDPGRDIDAAGVVQAVDWSLARAREPELAAEFTAARVAPTPVVVNFAGGHRATCWYVTRGDGDYRVVFMPRAGYFSLVVASVIGPLDIGVHGEAVDVFASV
ncbi:MAG: hypothetical protein AAF631_01205 [Pseudomonadota bacterium]